MRIVDVAAALERERAVADAETRADALAVTCDLDDAPPVAVRAARMPTYADAVERDEATPVAPIFTDALALALLVDFAVAVEPTRTNALAETDERDKATPFAVRAGTTPTKADAVDRDEATPVAAIFADALALALLDDCAVADPPMRTDAPAETVDRDEAAPEAVAPVAGFDAPVCDDC